MHKVIIVLLSVLILGAVPSAHAAGDGARGLFEVVGVEDDDMLKMRAGPGTGYRIVLGLPNGTVLRLHECDQTGSTRWCKVSLKQSRRVKGYVSWAYLKEM